MKRLLLAAAIICLISIPKQIFCQVDKAKVERAILEAMRRHGGEDKRGGKVSRIESEEAERQRQIWNDLEEMSEGQLLYNIDNSDYRSKILNNFQDKLKNGLASSNRILYYFDNDEALRDLILKDSSLREKMKDEIARKREKILDYAQNPHMNEFIMTDPTLHNYYIQMKEKQDIKRNPGKVIEDIRDPKLRQIIEEDPELVRILAQEIEKKAQEDRELQERLDADEKAEQNRKKREREKETTRIVDENNRASEQTKKNKIEQTKNKNLQDELKSSPIFVQLPDVSSLNTTIQDPDALKVKPIDIFGINYTDDRSEKGKDNPKVNNQKTQVDYFDDNIEKKPYFEEKMENVKDWWDANDYSYKMNKAFEASKETYSTMIKEAPDNARKKVISIPKDNLIDKLKGWGRNIINIAYPGANLEEKAEVVIEVEKNEKGFIEGLFSDIIDAVSTGDLQKFEGSTSTRVKRFDEKNRSLANRYIKVWSK